ncbi:MAG: hypothetical protein ABSA79_01870 [Candidatus Bathyarchaeia archaeon]
MKTSKKLSLCVLAMLCFSLAFTMLQSSFAQQGQQYPLTITIKDGVTGKEAQGVTTIVDTSSGSLVQDLGTVAENTTVNLPAGTYVIKTQLTILGVPITIQSYTVNLNQPVTAYLTVSAFIIPIQYAALIIYVIVIIIIIAILYVIIRWILKRATYKDPSQRKPT